jgi:hypothetical protein
VAVVEASNYTAFLAFYYVPLNHLMTNASLSPDMFYENSNPGQDRPIPTHSRIPDGNSMQLNIANGALFTQTNVQVNKLVARFSVKLSDMLSDIDEQVRSHK